ncbi:MAG: urease accessory protein UreF [Alphaproteobacteria bacterium]|nr:urease accessory protein UreF [Alphaproteobacteria bacterium]
MPTHTAMRTPMAEASLLRLLAWMSPGFPVGAYSYSHGIEYAVAAASVRDADSLLAWIEDVLALGGGRTDAILFAHAWRAARVDDAHRLAEVAELAAALPATPELTRETLQQGQAFVLAAGAAWPTRALADLRKTSAIAYPVAVGVACAAHGISLDDGLKAYLHGFAANLVSAGVRLIPLGQTQGQRLVAALESPILRLATAAPQAPLASAGSGAWTVDWCSIQHESQHTRLFRS